MPGFLGKAVPGIVPPPSPCKCTCPPPTCLVTFMASYSSLASYLYGGYMRAMMSLSNSALSSDFSVSMRS